MPYAPPSQALGMTALSPAPLTRAPLFPASFYMEHVRALLAHYDPSQPIMLSDNLWYAHEHHHVRGGGGGEVDIGKEGRGSLVQLAQESPLRNCDGEHCCQPGHVSSYSHKHVCVCCVAAGCAPLPALPSRG